MPAIRKKAVASPVSTEVDAGFLEGLVGYNARRASLSISEAFASRMADHGFSMVDFSVVSLVRHNPGITARQVGAALDILPPNMVSIIASLDKRSLIERRPHPTDGRAVCLHLPRSAQAIMDKAEAAVMQLEIDATRKLNPRERQALILLLQKIYK